jgi:hypothetical protein
VLVLGFEANSHISKVQRLENQVPHNNTNIARRRAVSNQKPQMIVKMKMCRILDKTKPQRTRDLNFVAEKLKII